MTAQEITRLIEENDEFENFGLRAHHDGWGDHPWMPLVAGQEPTTSSYRWDDGESTGEMLNGICALEITAENAERVLAEITAYPARQYALIAGNGYEYGEDDGEIIFRVRGAQVIAVW